MTEKDESLLSAEKREEDELPPFRGLYRHVKISVRALDFIIVACIAVIVIFTFVGLQNPGFSVTFESRGGTDVEYVDGIAYDGLIPAPEAPTREGYSFTGWYLEQDCLTLWDMENDRVHQDMTLYAGWEKK